MEFGKQNFDKIIIKTIDVEESCLILKNIRGSALNFTAIVCVCVWGGEGRGRALLRQLKPIIRETSAVVCAGHFPNGKNVRLFC